jgi:hypothetical protein
MNLILERSRRDHMGDDSDEGSGHAQASRARLPKATLLLS